MLRFTQHDMVDVLMLPVCVLLCRRGIISVEYGES